MVSKPDPSRVGLAAVGVLLSAVGLWWATGLTPIWWLTWLAPWPVLAVCARGSTRVAVAAAFAAWAGGGLNLWHYERNVLGMPAPVVIAAVVAPSLAFAAGAVLLRALARRGRPLLATLALPAWWTALEYLTSRVSPHGTFGSLAYTQLDFLPVVQLSALLGASGITFLLLLVPGALTTLGLPCARSTRARIAALVATAIVAVLGFGVWRLSHEGSARPPLTIGLVAADRPEQPVAAEAADGRRLIAACLETTRTLVAQGAQLVVWPETVLRASAEQLELLGHQVADATGGRVPVVVGLDRITGEGELNSAVILRAPGVAPTAYVKHHLLLPPEARYRPGSELVLVDLPSGAAGVAICKDLDFPALARSYAARGAGLLLVPAWDFGVDGWLHSRMAVLRGVEGGFAVARSARGGRLTLSDDRGRVHFEARSAEAPVASVLAPLRVGTAGTPYSRCGDWFAWLACGLAAFLLQAALRRQRRVPATKARP
jgi:apolipoprotein N-acyltransferase